MLSARMGIQQCCISHSYMFTQSYLVAVTPAHLSQERPILSPVLAHVEALKTLSKKKDSLRHSHQMGENAEDSAIQLPSDLDTPQCSRMVRELENALREGECDGLSGQGSCTASSTPQYHV